MSKPKKFTVVAVVKFLLALSPHGGVGMKIKSLIHYRSNYQVAATVEVPCTAGESWVLSYGGSKCSIDKTAHDIKPPR